MPNCPTRFVLLTTCLLLPSAADAQLYDEDFPPGLLARYRAAAKTVERIDPDLAFIWGTGAPDSRLPAGPFQAQWQSRLLVKQAGRYRFHVYLQGKVDVQVAGQRVLSGTAKQPSWISGQEFTLGFGDKLLEVQFTKTGQSAQIQMFWSSDAFLLEPIPRHLLFREESHPELSKIERGRIAFDAHRCNRCHKRQNDSPSPPAPALTHIAAGTSPNWLMRKIQQPGELSPHTRMPSFGFTADEARAIAAYLVKQSQPVKLSAPGAVQEKDQHEEHRKGEVLLRSVGCLACHRVGQQGQNGPYGGGDLSDIGRKRSAEWLNTWLTHPERLNPDHRMPVIKLTGNERRQIVLSLTALRGDSTSGTDKSVSFSEAPADLIVKGRELVRAARCAACHQIAGAKTDASGIPDLSKPVADWSKSCLAEQADRKTHRPVFAQIDRDAVKAFINSRSGTLSPQSAFARGRQVLERRNCLDCHERGDNPGIVAVAGSMARLDKDLQGKSQGLIPPTLNAVGDKLLDKSLAEAVAGEQPQVRMPWLLVRMPRFRHSPEEKRDLLTYLIGHDRIPDGAPSSRPIEAPSAADGSQTLVLGHTLVGPRGFSCIACHQIGSYVPRNVALGTRGSDLMMLGRRMRKEFYVRWTRSPIRIVPGMEMPSYVKAVPGLLDADVDRQLLATWNALNDPKFTPPTDPTAVEQFLVVGPGERARIVRDVFTNPQENGGGYVARALAIGFENGHNVLFDLDTYSLRGWYFGDFARQRTEGKSWYWDMAGIPIVSGFQTGCDFALLPENKKNAKLIFSKREHGTNGRLIGYAPRDLGLIFEYDLSFEVAGKVHRLTMMEIIKPVAAVNAGQRSGWTREIQVRGPNRAQFGSLVTRDHHVLISRPNAKATVGSPKIEAVRSLNGKWESFPGIKDREFLKMDVSSPGGAVGPTHRVATLRYSSSLKLEQSRIELKPNKEQLKIENVTSVPGFDGVRLPILRSIMPTAMTWTHDGKLAFTSLKGHVYIAHDTDGDGIEDTLTVFEEGLAAPFGIIADGKDLIVAHKPEVIRLRDTDGDGRADVRSVIATGWGYNSNYHDWTCGIVRDSQGNLYVGLGSDYNQKNRPQQHSRWRGAVLRIGPKGKITPLGRSFRYPVGLAISGDGDIFVSDNQGVQNTFNEINHLVEGRYYGVPSHHEPNPDAPLTPPAIQVPHPWTRSVNGLFFLPIKGKATNNQPAPAGLRRPLAGLAGHGIGCEYDSRFLIRFTLQRVGDVLQGAAYYFSRPNAGVGETNFVGPLCGAVAPNGDIYIGSIFDSGWLGGRNSGAITRLRPNGKLPTGIRELRARADGFQIEFNGEIDPQAASSAENYTISGYTRVWQGSYATPDSGRHRVTIKSVSVAPDRKSVTLKVDRLRQGYVYEVGCGPIGVDPNRPLWPATGHYTMHRIPSRH